MSKRYSYKDIESATKQTLRTIEQNRDRKAQEAADRLLYGTASDPRGLWKLFHLVGAFSGWLFYSAIIMMLGMIVLGSFGSFFPIISMIIGFIIIKVWFNSDSAKTHPFKSALLYCWAYPLTILMILQLFLNK